MAQRAWFFSSAIRRSETSQVEEWNTIILTRRYEIHNTSHWHRVCQREWQSEAFLDIWVCIVVRECLRWLCHTNYYCNGSKSPILRPCNTSTWDFFLDDLNWIKEMEKVELINCRLSLQLWQHQIHNSDFTTSSPSPTFVKSKWYQMIPEN